jgi:hypothetical protein
MRPIIFISAVSNELRSARKLVANTLELLGYGRDLQGETRLDTHYHVLGACNRVKSSRRLPKSTYFSCRAGNRERRAHSHT